MQEADERPALIKHEPVPMSSHDEAPSNTTSLDAVLNAAAKHQNGHLQTGQQSDNQPIMLLQQHHLAAISGSSNQSSNMSHGMMCFFLIGS